MSAVWEQSWCWQCWTNRQERPSLHWEQIVLEREQQQQQPSSVLFTSYVVTLHLFVAATTLIFLCSFFLFQPLCRLCNPCHCKQDQDQDLFPDRNWTKQQKEMEIYSVIHMKGKGLRKQGVSFLESLLRRFSSPPLSPPLSTPPPSPPSPFLPLHTNTVSHCRHSPVQTREERRGEGGSAGGPELKSEREEGGAKDKGEEIQGKEEGENLTGDSLATSHRKKKKM